MIADLAARQDIPDATVARPSQYLRGPSDLAGRGIAFVSFEELAPAAQERTPLLEVAT